MTQPTLAQEITRTPWVKSSYSTNPNGCVQIKRVTGHVVIGDTKNPHGPTITVPDTAWDTFLDQVNADARAFTGRLHAAFLPNGGFTLHDTTASNPTMLTYTRAEWDAFHAGVVAGELRSLATV